MLDHAWDLYCEADIFNALSYLAALTPEAQTVKIYADLANKLYWEKKDLAGVVAVSLAGLSLGWKMAEADSESATEILGIVKSISYNLASFTWPGWDETGIEIGRTDLTLGLVAAKTNLRLAEQLNKGALPLSRANWMLGAQHLAHKEYDFAEASFAISGNQALEANAPAEVLLADGFKALARLLGGVGFGANEQIQGIKQELETLEHGPGFVVQIETAHRVFAARGDA